jgi:hypothetical protein
VEVKDEHFDKNPMVRLDLQPDDGMRGMRVMDEQGEEVLRRDTSRSVRRRIIWIR